MRIVYDGDYLYFLLPDGVLLFKVRFNEFNGIL